MGKRQESRERIEAAIIEIGRRHLVTEGAAGLSLRAVARDLGMVSSAVYRYVAGRDELLTLLVVDAYTELARAVTDAVTDAVTRAGDWVSRIRAIAHATRDWALDQPARWALLYGSPVPGYHAPAERTVVPGTRVVAALFDAVAQGIAEGAVPASETAVPQPLSGDFARLRTEFGFAGDDATLVRCFALWAGLIGAVSLEVFGQYGPDTLTDPCQLFDLQIGSLIDTLRN
ncbi:TetR/AcrR family transcriptional regulator [Mycolicibacterium goodii]|uniref:TetR family transcriptional regulator n=1 Tax=Mycolicibacterium goodii TaxID=134601 RepID=A0A0K0X9I1_MYCGD|nr:TetR family transcriptional regulator [Mycolicibacterium goodii]